MTTSLQAVTKNQLISIARQEMLSYPDYINGMTIDDVDQNEDLLLFSGECFLQEDGAPTANSIFAFNLFKYLTQTLSKRYYLIDTKHH